MKWRNMLLGVIFLFAFNLVPRIGGGPSGSQILWVESDASCGGFAPCFRTIQEAITVAESGAIIRIRSGSYLGPIMLNKSVTLTGESKAVKISQNPTSSDDIIVKVAASVSVTVEKVLIEGDKKFNTPFNHGIVVTGGNSTVNISDCQFSHLYVGVRMAAEGTFDTPLNSQVILRDSQFSDYAIGSGVLIATDGTQPQYIEGNKFSRGGSAIIVFGKGKVWIRRNQIIKESQGYGLNGGGLLVDGSVEATVQDNVITGQGVAVLFEDSAQGEMTNNKFLDSDQDGVIIRDKSRVKLVENTISSNGHGSVFYDVVFSYDPFYGNGMDRKFTPRGFGIVVGPGATAELYANKIDNNVIAVGVTQSLRPGSLPVPTKLVMQKNELRDNDRGVWLRGADATLIENEITNTNFNAMPAPLLDALFPAAGVMVQDGKPLLQANRILENRLGVLLQQQASPTFIANQIQKNADYGIALYKKDCFSQFASELEFKGQLQGENNELSGNKTSNLCPKDYPLPPGFLK